MRPIVKAGIGTTHLNAEHANPPQTADEASQRWQRFRHGKARVLNHLLDEQYQLCCYSEIRPDRLGLGCHIEHVQPKSQYPLRTLDYQNLAASALDSDNDLKAFKAQAHESFGGHAKLNDYDATLFISCHQSDCARFFAYLSDGRVVAASGLAPGDTAKADYTIALLNVNSPYLVTQRQGWWDELADLFAQHQAKGWSLQHLVAVDLVPVDRSLSPFFSLTRQFFGQVAEQVVAQQAPQLL